MCRREKGRGNFCHLIYSTITPGTLPFSSLFPWVNRRKRKGVQRNRKPRKRGKGRGGKGEKKPLAFFTTSKGGKGEEFSREKNEGKKGGGFRFGQGFISLTQQGGHGKRSQWKKGGKGRGEKPRVVIFRLSFHFYHIYHTSFKNGGGKRKRQSKKKKKGGEKRSRDLVLLRALCSSYPHQSTLKMGEKKKGGDAK